MREGLTAEVQGCIESLGREINRLKGALEKISLISNKTTGGDWDEIEEARAIAKEALRNTPKGRK